MLNRRILRVKAMQALYGYFTAVESIKEVKREELREEHSLDPAKHDFADKALFEARKKQAVRLFNQNLLNPEIASEETIEDDVKSSVNDAIDAFNTAIGKEATSRKNEMMKEARKLHETYLKLLVLPLEIEQREKLDQEKEEKAYIAKAKKHYPFIQDPLLLALKSSEVLNKEVARESVSWGNEQDVIKSW